MRIQTDSTPVEVPKNPDSCTVFQLYSLLATSSETETLRKMYAAGGMGYGDAKQQLLEVILNRFKEERVQFEYYQSHPQEVQVALTKGAEKAKQVAHDVLLRVRDKLGY